jgi:cytochrome P450
MSALEKVRFAFDHHSASYATTWPELAREIHRLDYPLAWSESHGGYWVLADWAATKASLEDWETFSSDNDLDGTRKGGRGVTVPRQPYSLVLNESDPPVHTARRRAEMPFFLPKMLRHWEQVAQAHLDEALAAVIEKGSCDLVRDVIVPTTARTTFEIVGWDMSRWEDAAFSAHAAGFITPGAPGYPFEEMARLRTTFRQMLADRRENPREDIATALARAEVNGRPMTIDEGESMISALVFGGFDTTTSAALHALIWLDRHRDVHARLIEDVAYLNNAIEEFLRMFSPATGIARTAMRPVELGGQRIEAGEPVYFWLAAANRDPRKFEDPERMWLERPNARDHVAFSAGGHRCLGAPLAKVELRLMLQTILARMPDYQIDHDEIEPYPSLKSTNGLIRVPVTFTPATQGLVGAVA